MADHRSNRYSPTSRMSTLPNLGNFSPPNQSNGTKHMNLFTSPDTLSQLPGLSPTMDRRNNHRNSEPSDTLVRWMIRIRRLPRHFTDDALGNLLIFAKDIDDTKFVQPSDQSTGEDSGFSSAIAIFHSEAGAMEAKERLDGKTLSGHQAPMIVEVISPTPTNYNGSRRNTVDGTAIRQQTISGASNNPNLSENTLSRQSSRFTSTWQNIPSQNVTSPLTSPLVSTANVFDFPAPDGSNRLQGLFSPQSPVANAYSDLNRVSGKSVINAGQDDDETGELLKDPVGYAQNGRNYDSVLSSFNNLSLDTSRTNGNSYSSYVASPSSPNYASPHSVRSPALPGPARAPTASSNGTYQTRNLKHDYPPANPADQNPPCNTLYVGNLPVNTSEDELKSLFSKARGFKRLCFRTKSNGPMCFVEFEDTSYASHALHELYGVQLHNSYKGGIRVSFSKNPLGVRSDNRNHPGMGPHAGPPGYGNGMPGSNFGAAAGPPPGLPGLPGQQTHVAPPMHNNAGRGGYAPQALYRASSPYNHNYSQQGPAGPNGYIPASRNLSAGQHSYQQQFGSMNSFLDQNPPINGNSYSNGNGQNGFNGHNGR
ncbi:hypothetical protein E4T43_06676 [Aureobasidium subglaciale]|nr:hypothetical protein E4T43_06676 [Aureobasidium subglaciale]